MMTLCLFAPLAPSDDYPHSAFHLTLDDVPYDLPLPLDVGDELASAIKSVPLGFRRVDDYCNADGIELAWEDPARLEFESKGHPAYAEFEARVEASAERATSQAGAALRRGSCARARPHADC